MNWIKKLINWLFGIENKPEPEKPAMKDDKDFSFIQSVKDTQVNPLPWDIECDLKVTVSGNKIILECEGTSGRKWTDKSNVSGNAIFIVLRDGEWKAFCWDYLRPGQSQKEMVWFPPKEGQTYETVRKGEEEAYMVVTGLCRDGRRNVAKRSRVVRFQ